MSDRDDPFAAYSLRRLSKLSTIILGGKYCICLYISRYVLVGKNGKIILLSTWLPHTFDSTIIIIVLFGSRDAHLRRLVWTVTNLATGKIVQHYTSTIDLSEIHIGVNCLLALFQYVQIRCRKPLMQWKYVVFSYWNFSFNYMYCAEDECEWVGKTIEFDVNDKLEFIAYC